jgi:hypothetical protein
MRGAARKNDGAATTRDQTAASALVLTGFKKPPTVEFNRTVQPELATRMIHGDLAYIVPLQATMKSATEMENEYFVVNEMITFLRSGEWSIALNAITSIVGVLICFILTGGVFSYSS